MIGRSYPSHNLLGSKLRGRESRPERSRFETSTGRLCHASDQVLYSRAVSQWLVGTRRTAPLYSEGTHVAPDGRTDFDPLRFLRVPDIGRLAIFLYSACPNEI